MRYWNTSSRVIRDMLTTHIDMNEVFDTDIGRKGGHMNLRHPLFPLTSFDLGEWQNGSCNIPSLCDTSLINGNITTIHSYDHVRRPSTLSPSKVRWFEKNNSLYLTPTVWHETLFSRISKDPCILLQRLDLPGDSSSRSLNSNVGWSAIAVIFFTMDTEANLIEFEVLK